MKFRVDQAKMVRGDPAPCEGAVREGGGWVIELPNLQDLIDLSRQVDSSLILATDTRDGVPWLTIYNYYVE